MKLSPVCALLFGFAFISTGCSDDKSSTEPVKTGMVSTSNNPTAHHPKEDNVQSPGEASKKLKQQFAEAFAQACVTRELKNSNNPDVEEKRFQENCACIAEHIADDLAEVDAEKYLEDHEDTQALGIKFDTAAFFCLQNKPQPKGPHLFGRQ